MINKVILIGNVGADPEIRTLESGVKVARVRLATTERIYNRSTQETTEHTEWHTVTLWRNLADLADRFIRKGTQIYVEGRIRTRDWTDQSGNKRFSTEIMADDVKLLGRKSDNPGSSQQPQGYGTQSSGPGYASSHGQSYGAGQGGGFGQQHDAPSVSGPEDDPDDLPF